MKRLKLILSNAVPFLLPMAYACILFPGAAKHIQTLCSALFLLGTTSVLGSPFFTKKSKISAMTFLAVVFLVAKYASSEAVPHTGLPENSCSAIYATALQDSVKTQNVNLITAKLSSVCAKDGTKTTAKGIVTASFTGNEILTAGSRICFQGTFKDGFFRSNHYTVLKTGILHKLRRALIFSLYRRLGNENCLSIMLLTGRGDNSVFYLKNAAENAGCLHILALSGMHLNVLTKIRKLFGKRKKTGKAIACIPVVFLLLLAGPRPSLIRAALMFFFDFLPQGQQLLATYAVHILLFPNHISNIGFCYAYMASFAISLFSPVFENTLDFIKTKKIKQTFAVSFCAGTFTSALQIIKEGCWHKAVFIASPVAGVLVTLCLYNAVLLILFGNISILCKTDRFLEKAMYLLFDKSSAFFKNGNTAGYLILILITAGIITSRSLLRTNENSDTLLIAYRRKI